MPNSVGMLPLRRLALLAPHMATQAWTMAPGCELGRCLITCGLIEPAWQAGIDPKALRPRCLRCGDNRVRESDNGPASGADILGVYSRLERRRITGRAG